MVDLKNATQKRYEVLLTEYEGMEKKYNDLLKLFEEKEGNKNMKDSDCQTSADTDVAQNNIKPQSSVDLTEEIKNMITTEIPDKYFETSKENASGLETVAALEKMLSHTMARVEASEAKIRDLLKELRSRDNDVQEIEDENKTLRLKIEELKEECDNLPTIAENSEDVEALESKVIMLENEISILREVRSNLEVEHNNSRSEIESLIRQLQTTEAIVRNQDNLQTENSKYKEHEQELLKQLNDAEKTREEMLSELNHLQHTVSEQQYTITELSQSKIQGEELMHQNLKLEHELTKIKESEVAYLKLLEELQREKSLRIKIEEEKENLFAKLTKLEKSEEQNQNQGIELEKEQNIRVQLQEENAELHQTIISLQDTDRERVKVIENLQNELNLKNQLEETVDTMHAEIKRLEKECEMHTNLLKNNSNESELKLKELKSLNSCLSQKCVKLEKEMFDLSDRSDKLQIEIDSKDRKLCEMLLEKSVSDKGLEEIKVHSMGLEKELTELQTKISLKDETLIQEFKDIFSPIFNTILSMNDDYHMLMQEVAKQSLLLQEEKNQLLNENESLSDNFKILLSEVNDKTECVLKLTAQMETLQAEKHSIEDRLRNVNDSVSTGNQTDELDGTEVTQENFAAVCKELEESQISYKELEEKYNKLLSSSDQSLSHVNEQLRSLNNERQQLIETVQVSGSSIYVSV